MPSDMTCPQHQLSKCIPNADAAGILLHINTKFQWENLNQLFCRKVLFLTDFLFMNFFTFCN
jgi:hypothetical protein